MPMHDYFLFITPLLVLAVVLLAGFAGCGFEAGVVPPDPLPAATLTFSARVPTGLAVVGGVKFAWTRPTGTIEETMTVTSFAADGADNVYRHEIPSPEAGMSWLGRCEMTVQEGSQTADASSGDNAFDLPAPPQHVLSYRAEGSPASPPFRVVFVGLSQA